MQNAINRYIEAESASRKAFVTHLLAVKEEGKELKFMETKKGSKLRDDPEQMKKMSTLKEAKETSYQTECRAVCVRKAAAHIAERRIMEAAIPIVEAILKKYAGKSAMYNSGKVLTEIAEAIGNGAVVRFFAPAYGMKPNCINIQFSQLILHDLEVEIYAKSREAFVNDNNRFIVPEFAPVDNSGLPDDPEAIAHKFE